MEAQTYVCISALQDGVISSAKSVIVLTYTVSLWLAEW